MNHVQIEKLPVRHLQFGMFGKHMIIIDVLALEAGIANVTNKFTIRIIVQLLQIMIGKEMGLAQMIFVVFER